MPEAGVGAASYVLLSPPEEAAARAAAKPDGDDAGAVSESVAAVFFQAAEPVGLLAAPRYPRDLWRPGASAAILTVRVRIDAHGQVLDVATSPAGLSTHGRAEDVFLDAVRVAAREWRFQPARVLRATPPREPGAAPGLHAETVASELDLQFTFVP